MMMMSLRGNAQSCTSSTFIFGSFGASPAGEEGTTTSSATNTTTTPRRRREERRYRRRRVMLALVDRDDAHGGVDVDADEYMCGMDGGTAREREREREREKEREFFVCVVQQSERL